MDLIDDDLPGPERPGNAHEYTVSDLSGAVKRTLEGEFGRVRVRGEVGRVVIARTGHMYFDLKDDRAVIASVSWKGQVARMTIRPEEGMEVIATGRLTTFAPQSKYQLQVDNVEPAGAGALMAMLEARRKKLAAEGLFDAGRKRPIPFLPQVIGVITSAQGAVIRDILHRLADRFPRRVIVWPVAVQGERCPRDVVRAIEGFNALQPGGPVPRPDVLIVARGGGSIEDLWGFNDEAVVRAAAASAIPLISAVGHETDTTLIDHAADLRAPTPTAAAELAVPVRAELLAQVAALGARLHRTGGAAVEMRTQRLRDLARALPRPEALLATPVQRLDRAGDRFAGSLKALAARKLLELNRAGAGLRPGTLRARIEQRTERLAQAGRRLTPALAQSLSRKAERLEGPGYGPRAEAALSQRLTRATERLEALSRMHRSLGYPETLARGYAVLRDAEGRLLTTADAARGQAVVTAELRDGSFEAVPVGGSPRPRRKPAEPPKGQGSLF
ncbi:exodeoxyribonuclease VII large subunit [Pararhodobacter aggregans]|uniref:Exodeoxyribonuclease 7 large subunit n=1 Tax=Pararhodobacter aggregans TaxID=404875 RepID=A0A2T7UWU9_9RHOB|nr:exodeoxyribonuclease VII large subunit [Pararhodobacter aggregans]PTX04689.1 exodeoxyribonuclease VII large subunit [Pararhodobacter aggregans]PVE49028.1 exodeoxyribonuclease VII large subunit [Pararhodobacter aggregans]